MSDIRLADISEFQSNIDAPTYLGAGYECVICRTHNGNRADNMMPGRRDYLRRHNFTGIGWYQYLVADRDPAAQARDFIASVGDLQGNEWPVLDLEAGSGDQTSRAQQWFDVVDAWAGFPAMLYSGDYFLRDQLGGSGHWQGRPVWVAAYQSSEPSQEHHLWQHTDSYSFAGIGSCDGNIHHGTATEFVKTCRGGTATTPPLTEEDIVAITAALNDGGALHVFLEASDGSVWYTWQKKGQSQWQGGQSGKSVAGFQRFAPAPVK